MVNFFRRFFGATNKTITEIAEVVENKKTDASNPIPGGTEDNFNQLSLEHLGLLPLM